MATQMAALDEFVTRARSQNDRHHASQIQSLQGISSNAHQTLSGFGESLKISATSLPEYSTDLTASVFKMQDSLAPFTEEVCQPLNELRLNVQARSPVDYMHTGETPQKKDWSFPSTLPKTDDHEVLIAHLRGLPDPRSQLVKTPGRTPGRSPRKLNSPSKLPSPSKAKIFTDENSAPSLVRTESNGGLKEIDMNVIGNGRPMTAEGGLPIDFSKSVGAASQQPPLKRHATEGMNVSRLPTKPGGSAGRTKAEGRENVNVLSQSVGAGGGRRLRSSPQQ